MKFKSSGNILSCSSGGGVSERSTKSQSKQRVASPSHGPVFSVIRDLFCCPVLLPGSAAAWGRLGASVSRIIAAISR